MRSFPRAAGVILTVVMAVSSEAAWAGDFLNKPAEQWVLELRHNRAGVRRGAAFALGQMGLEVAGAVPALVDTLQTDSDPSVREAAAFALGEIGPTVFDARVVPALVKALADGKDPELRRSAAYALGRYAGMRGFRDPKQQKDLASQVAPILRQALADPQPGVRQNAAWALGQLGGEVGSDAVTALGQTAGRDADALVRRDSALALGKVGREALAAGPVLLGRFKDDTDGVVRKTALAALVSVVGPEDQGAAAELQRLLKDPDEEVVHDAAFALANIGGEAAVPAVPVLRKFLKDDDDLTRRLAATALAGIGKFAAEAVPDLSASLSDPDREVRRGAAVALSRMGPAAREALPDLIKSLTNAAETDEVRKYAGEAISAIDPNDRDVVAGLLKVLQEKGNGGVRPRGIWGLSRVKNFQEPGVIEGLTRMLSETGPEAKFLRYESAVTLAVRLKDKVPEQVFGVILEALGDSTVLVYTGTGAKVNTGASESRTGGTQVEETGEGDWRAEVAKAVGQIGRKANRKEIVDALKKVEKDSFDPEARKSATAARKALLP